MSAYSKGFTELYFLEGTNQESNLVWSWDHACVARECMYAGTYSGVYALMHAQALRTKALGLLCSLHLKAVLSRSPTSDFKASEFSRPGV